MDVLRIHCPMKTIANSLNSERRLVRIEKLLTHAQLEFIFLLFL
jgi:hypothetical protein